MSKHIHKKTLKRVKLCKKRTSPDNLPTSTKRLRRSEAREFVSSKQCLFCGNICQLDKDPKNPSRWRPAYTCRKDENHNGRNIKQAILETCNARKNALVRQKIDDFCLNLAKSSIVNFMFSNVCIYT